MKKSFMLIVCAVAAVAVAGVAAAATVVVHPGNLDGWTPTMSGGSTLTFVNGPGTPPLGTGSARFTVDATGATAAQLRNNQYHGTLLTSLTNLEYSTYETFANSQQAVYIILNVDYNTDGLADDLLFFEPVYQGPAFCANAQATVALGVWQTWDALNGCWWSLAGTAGAGPGTDSKPLSAITALHPGAAIVNTPTGLGGVRLVAGFGGPGDWGNFDGNADAFTIGVSNNDTTYDFELAAPIVTPPSKDACKNGGWQNYQRADGSSFKNQGDCIQYVNTGK